MPSFSLSPPFCTEGWASSLSGSDHVWMCSSFVPPSSLLLFHRWLCDPGVVILSLHFFFNFTFVVFLSSICSFTLNLETLLRLHLKVIQVFLVWVTAVRSIHYFKKNTFRITSWIIFQYHLFSISPHSFDFISYHFFYNFHFHPILCVCIFNTPFNTSFCSNK